MRKCIWSQIALSICDISTHGLIIFFIEKIHKYFRATINKIQLCAITSLQSLQTPLSNVKAKKDNIYMPIYIPSEISPSFLDITLFLSLYFLSLLLFLSFFYFSFILFSFSFTFVSFASQTKRKKKERNSNLFSLLRKISHGAPLYI